MVGEAEPRASAQNLQGIKVMGFHVPLRSSCLPESQQIFRT